jgi:hypothetical protein
MSSDGSRQRDVLIEQVMTAWRPRGRGGEIHGHPAWHDLSEEDREAAYEATCELRRLETALDPEGVTTTARAVLHRIRGQSRGRSV